MRKFLPKILILLAIFAGVGFFGNAEKASAQDTTTKYCYDAKFFEQKGVTKAECNKTGDQWLTRAEAAKGLADSRQTDPTKKMCFDSKGFGTSDKTEEDCLKTSGNVWRTAGEQAQTGIAPAAKSEFENQLKLGCSNLITDFDGCTLQLLYWIFHDIPAWFLVQTAYFFNIMMSVSLDGKLFKQGFVSSGWGIVRDLSNIFFILVLLYVAIKIILGLAGHGVKETIAKVVVVALLINFSMFFTGIVIDTSNMLALVFYNKLKVTTTVNGQERPYASARGEKDVSGGMVAAFDPTRALSQEFFTEARKVFINGERAESLENHDLPFGTILAVIIISGLVMGFAIYALFVSAFAFVARLIELWLLIIASPFAFMSSTMHEMEGIKDWGWKAWLHRLITASFMAPAFMFFLYFIFLLIQSNIFKDIVGQPTPGTDDPAGIIKLLLGILMPMMLVLTLLLKAVKLAKSGAGQFGEAVMKIGGQVGGLATGLALGAATGGAGMALRGTLGRGAANLSESNKFRDWASNSKIGAGALKFTSGIANKSFDLRKAPGMDSLTKNAGINLGAAKSIGLGPKEGFTQNRAAAIKKKEEFANKLLDTSDYGKAELSRGGMDRAKATELMKQMQKGGMSQPEALRHYLSLIGNGIQTKDLSNVARHLNTARRNTFADRLEKREVNWGSKAGVINAKKRISANKIRKDVAQQKEEASLAHLVHELEHKMSAGHGEEKPHKQEEHKTEKHEEHKTEEHPPEGDHPSH